MVSSGTWTEIAPKHDTPPLFIDRQHFLLFSGGRTACSAPPHFYPMPHR